MLSCVLIIPAALRDKANALAEAMGWGPNNYSVPLSASGAEPISHYGLHAWVGPEFVDLLAAADRGEMPAALNGYPPEEFAAVVGSLRVSIQQGVQGHFAEICRANELAIVTPPEA